MTLADQVEKFGKDFISIPVTNVRYWKQLEMNIGEVLVGCEKHPINSTIAFEFYDMLNDTTALAYKHLEHYQNE